MLHAKESALYQTKFLSSTIFYLTFVTAVSKVLSSDWKTVHILEDSIYFINEFSDFFSVIISNRTQML